MRLKRGDNSSALSLLLGIKYLCSYIYAEVICLFKMYRYILLKVLKERP